MSVPLKKLILLSVNYLTFLTNALILGGLTVNSEKVKYGIIMAMSLEAKSFVQGLNMDLIETVPFPVYRHRDIGLIISGIGRVRAAAASAYFINRYSPEMLINMGTAGSNIKDLTVGSFFSISSVFDGDLALYRGPEYHEYKMETFPGLSSATLLTSDRPSITFEERSMAAKKADLSDMEGSSFAQVCSLFNKKGYIFKIVSDAPGAESFKSVREGIVKHSEELYSFFKTEILTDF